MPVAVAIPAVVIFAAALGSFVAYELLVRREYAVAREAWEADGRPPGFAWAPAGTSVMRSWTRGKAYFRWIAETPSWIRQDKRARSLQTWLRILWITACAAWLWVVMLALVRPELV
jgi:hypothetical protein